MEVEALDLGGGEDLPEAASALARVSSIPWKHDILTTPAMGWFVKGKSNF